MDFVCTWYDIYSSKILRSTIPIPILADHNKWGELISVRLQTTYGINICLPKT